MPPPPNKIFRRRPSHPRSTGPMFNKTPLKSFHQTWHVKKKKKVPRNPKGAPAVYLILLCGAIRRTGAERATEWRKWRIHYLAKGANSRAEMDPPWAFFSYSSSSFGAVNIKQWRRRGMRGRGLKGRRSRSVTWQDAICSTELDGPESSLTHSRTHHTSPCGPSLATKQQHSSSSFSRPSSSPSSAGIFSGPQPLRAHFPA